jgi:hypothetical protein
MVPQRYHHYLSVFDKKEANRFPGPCYRPQGRLCAKRLQNLSLVTCGAHITRHKDHRTIRQGVHKTIKVPPSISILLCWQKRWKTPASSRLSILEHSDNQKCLPHTVKEKTVQVFSSFEMVDPVTPGVERLRTGACGVVVVVVSGGVTGSEIGRGIC